MSVEDTELDSENQDGAVDSAEDTKVWQDSDVREIIQGRDKAKEKARKLEQDLAGWKQKFEGLQKQVGELKRTQSQEPQAADEAKQWKGRFEALKEEHEQAQQALARYQEVEAKQVRQARESALVDAIASKTGVQNRRLLHGLLLVAQREHNVDIAPDEIEADEVRRIAKLLKEIEPSVFDPEKGRSVPAPGASSRTKAQPETREDAVSQHRKALESLMAGRKVQ